MYSWSSWTCRVWTMPRNVAQWTVPRAPRLFGPAVIAAVGMLSTAYAQTASVTETGPGISYEMPSVPEQKPAAPGEAREAPYPRSIFTDEELKRLKKLPAGPAPSQDVVPQKRSSTNGPEPQAVTTNCATNAPNGLTPPDIHGAVGPTNLVVVTNTAVGVFSKSNCTQVSFTAFSTFFSPSGVPAGTTLFDPRVLYDQSSGRFFVTVESQNSGNSDQYQYFAVSQNNTGTTWWLYRITLSEGANFFCKRAAATFWDYPNIGSMNSRWFIAGSDFPGGSITTLRGAVISLDKTPSLSGQSVNLACFNNITASHIAPPIVQDSAGTGYLLSPVFAGNSVRRFALTPSGSGPASDSLVETSAISVPAWAIAPSALQPNGQGLDSLDGRFQSSSIQSGTSLWNVHTIAQGSFARLRLYQFSTTGTSPLMTFTPTTVGGNNDHLFNPSVAVNATTAFVTASRTIPSDSTNGNAAMLVFSGPNSSASGWGFDLVATSTAQMSIVGTGAEPNTLCNNSQRGDCRWGDYSSTQIDPSNSTMAWGFNELVTGTTSFDWATRGAQVGVGGGGPPNDNFANATTILLGQTLAGTNTGATKEPGEPNHAGNAGGKSVWWNFQALGTGPFVVKTAGSNFDTLLGVYTGSSVGALTAIASNDDFGGLQSQVIFNAIAGTTYRIAVDGFNSGSGAASGNIQLFVGPASAALTHDFNGDAKSDIAWRDTGGTTAVWLMNGAQVASAGLVGSAPTSWAIVGQRDFDGGGEHDWLWRDTSGNTAIWFLSGAQVGAAVGLGNVSTAWTVAGTGDFNGDGKGDILWRHSNGSVAVWLMSGSVVSSAAVIGSAPTSWSIVGIGDFDGTSKSDILWRDTGGNTAIWFLNGTQVTSAVGLGAVSTVWAIVGTGDFDGNGKSDILWRNTNGSAAVWIMNGAQVSSSAVIGSAPTVWTISETGDFDGSGKSDLLWRDTSGNTAIWFMNGTQVASAVGLGAVPTTWTIQGLNAD